MRSKKKVLQGAVLHKEKPFVYVLSSKVRTEHCDFCFNRTKLQKCSNCRYVYYCGKACQREGWNVHKLECRNLKQIAPRVIPDAARFLARLIKILNKGGGTETKSYYEKNNFRMYKDLMSHYPNIKNDQRRMDHFTSLFAVLYEYFGDDTLPNSAELMGMYGRMCINSFNILNQEMQCLGTGMYLGASVIDHSCEPNAVAVFEGTTLFIRALKTFQYLDWSEIFISYIDVLDTTEARQKELQTIYYFLCQCSKCLTPEFPKDMIAACPNVDCNNCILIGKHQNCSECGEEICQKFIDIFYEILEFTDNHLNNMQHLAYYDVCMICLAKQKGVLHQFNIKHVKTVDLAFQSSIDFEKWDSAREFGLELIDAYYKYYGEISPLTGLLQLKLGKIFLFQNDVKLALKHLKQASNILRITHGTNSNLYKNHLIPLLQQATLENSLNCKENK